ncbi:MAG: hypothetical protein DRH17_13205 [Deltaproteobacteria bacterium]|nr:MAG: hypothetical protein DRH17_13205 [Deltaproteobacteria bacterium]
MSEKSKTKITLSVQGKEINYEHNAIDIDKLSFYKKNPRIATIVSERTGPITDEVIDKLLWDRNETHRLRGQIERDGGLIHPVLVYHGEVLEGNTRLCCYRHLYRTTKNEKWKYIKCHLILDDLEQSQIYRLLCTEHIEGKIEWDAYEKANLYCKMKNEENMTLEQISAIVGESTPTVGYRIKAYKLMVKNGVIEKNKYSHFEQLVRNPDVQDIKKRNPKIEQHIVKLIKEDKIPKATDVRLIGDIHKHKKARKRLFVNGENIGQVYHDLKAKAPMTDSPFMKDVEGLIKRTKELKRADREGLQKNRRDCVKIEQLAKELIKLCRELNIKIHIPKNLRK